MPLYIAKSGDLEGCHACLTDRLTTLKDRATQLLIKYKSGALVMQKSFRTMDHLVQEPVHNLDIKITKEMFALRVLVVVCATGPYKGRESLK